MSLRIVERWSRLPRDGRDTLFLLAVIGWTVLPSNANFFVCHAGIEQLVPDPDPGTSLSVHRDGLRIKPAMTDLRERGIKLRDCTSFGLPGHLRLSVQTPAAQDALHHAWQNIRKASS